MSAREYREHLYTQRHHPTGAGALAGANQTLAGLYWTLVPFILGEYWAELKTDTLPAGIVFPTAYLLFWAFYYTYYRPGSLESKLSSPDKWDLFGLPTVLVGICVWFVKVAVVEATEVIVSGILPKKRKKPHYRRQEVRGNYTAPQPPPSQAHGQVPLTLPKEIENALAIMGLSGCRDWRTIQKRYRELAKKYHPDLNQDLTSGGSRFMIYDAAYRRLYAVRGKYFNTES